MRIEKLKIERERKDVYCLGEKSEIGVYFGFLFFIESVFSATLLSTSTHSFLHKHLEDHIRIHVLMTMPMTPGTLVVYFIHLSPSVIPPLLLGVRQDLVCLIDGLKPMKEKNRLNREKRY